MLIISSRTEQNFLRPKSSLSVVHRNFCVVLNNPYLFIWKEKFSCLHTLWFIIYFDADQSYKCRKDHITNGFE